jgi:hypothetical protein
LGAITFGRGPGCVGACAETEGTTTGAVNVFGAAGVVALAAPEALLGNGGGGGNPPDEDAGDERATGNGSEAAGLGTDAGEAAGTAGRAGPTTVLSPISSGTLDIAFARACI